MTINYTRKLTEFGVGYYKDLTGKKRLYFECFAGLGFGKSNFTDVGKYNNTYHNNFYNMSVSKFYLQPILMGRSKGSFSSSFSNKISEIKFSKISTDYTPDDLHNYRLDSLQSYANVFWEPAYVAAFGFKGLPGLKLEFQTGFSFLLSNHAFDYKDFNFSAGVVFDIPKFLAAINHSSIDQ